MALNSLHQSSIVRNLEAFRSERNMLVQLDMFSDGCGLADNYSCPVIDKKSFSY